MRSVARNLTETYDAEPSSVGRARIALADFAAGAGASPSLIDSVRLATSEAMTNAVLHAYRGQTGSIYVSAAAVAGELWILISDDGCGLEPRTDRPGLGLGLGLISQVSDDLQIVPRATGGTEVRIRFNLTSGAGRDASTAPTTAPRSRKGGARGPARSHTNYSISMLR
jgi:anti-sigma regulatory factor (Ser/Thr protein kinase)